MIFQETIDRLLPEVNHALDEVFTIAQSNQTHEQDILLIEINASYEEMHKGTDMSPYVFGPGGWVYHADHTQYRYYDSYRRTISQEPREEYFKDYDTNKDKQAVYEFLMQTELTIYLKFWESDPMLKRLYELSLLAQGLKYDWHYGLSQEDSRQILIREKIRDPIKDLCPNYYKLLKDIYLSQIRNAVAHTQFYIINTKLGFANVDPEKYAPLSQIDFKEWEERFHKLILLYNGIIERFNKLHESYILKQVENEFGLDIRLTDTEGNSKTSFIKYVDVGRKDWMWYTTWEKHYKYRGNKWNT